MNHVLARVRVVYKIWMIAGIALASLILIESIFLLSLKHDLLTEKELKTRHLVETAYGVIEFFYKEVRAGKFSDEEGKVKAMDVLRSLRYEENEYFWINDMTPLMVMHPFRPELNGKDLSDFKDPVGKRLFVDMVDVVKDEKSGFVRYLWPKPGFSEPVQKISYVKGFEPWGWIVGSGIYVDDVNALFLNKTQKTAILMIVIAFILIGASLILARSITRPLAVLQERFNAAAEGDFRAASQEQGRTSMSGRMDEIHQLLNAANIMTDNLQSLIGQVQRSGIQVATSATEIAASARQIEATYTEQAASIQEVSATSKEISATSEDLSRSIEDMGKTVLNTADMADKGRNNLVRMEEVMRQLTDATLSISSKLGAIHEKTDKISGVVAMINKISDQTNLLSLNAAIEAEKAGEYGRGFSVVAREISRLADQAAIATEDIETMVQEMQSSVSAGVKETEQFAREIRQAVEDVAGIGGQMSEVIEQVRLLPPQFGLAVDGMHAQAEGAGQISEAMLQLSQAAAQTKQALSEFKLSVDQMDSAVQGLRSEVIRFKIQT